MTSVEVPTVIPTLADIQIISASAGAAHTALAAADGTVLAFGLNEDGQVGIQDAGIEVSSPLEVSTLPERIVAVAAGNRHTLALAESGNVWSWGCNQRGQLGLGKEIEQSAEPKPIASLVGNKIVRIAAGAEHSLAVSESGEVYSWGCGSDGRLGHKRFKGLALKDEWKPRLLRQLETKSIQSISAGQMHSACVSRDGQAFLFGSGRYHQLGRATDEDAESPILVQGLSLVRELSCGSQHTLAALWDGSVAAFGANQNGSLGLGNTRQIWGRGPLTVPGLRAQSISAGWKHSAAIDADGRLYTWGWGGSQGTALSFEDGGTGGQLGLGDDNDRWEPSAVEWLSSSTPSGTIPWDSWKAVQVSCGLQHTVALVSLDPRL